MADGRCVLVTGGTGFIGGHIVKQLLAGECGELASSVEWRPGRHEGADVAKVVCTVRSEASAAFLTDFGPGRLALEPGVDMLSPLLEQQLVKALKEHSIDLVVHAAATVSVSMEPADTILPAVRGTLGVLRAIGNSPRVSGLAFTSSNSAVRCPMDMLDASRTLDESNWNQPRAGKERHEIDDALAKHDGSVLKWLSCAIATPDGEAALVALSFAKSRPYEFAKTYTEMLVQEFIADLNLRADRKVALATFCPTLVIGPQLSNRVTDSNSVVKSVVGGGYPLLPDLNWDMVDVRDVAAAHVRALMAGIEGRFVVSAHASSMSRVSRVARERFPKAKIPPPSPLLPKALMYLVALFDKRLTFAFVRDRVGAPGGDHSSEHCRETLGVPGISLSDSVADACASFKHYAILPDLDLTPGFVQSKL